MQRWIVAALMFVALAVPIVAAKSSDVLVVSQRLRLNKERNGVDGWLLVMIDARISEKLRKEMWGVGDWAFVIPGNDPLYKLFSTAPPQKALLRIVDGRGEVLAEQAMEQPLAKIESMKLVSDTPTFLVTIDYSIGMGSYAGLSTRLLDISNARLNWLQATDAKTNKREPIRLQRALKSDWKLSPRGSQQDILHSYCRPAGGNDFVVTHVRYNFDGTRWVKHERAMKGFWESDGPFPADSQFP